MLNLLIDINDVITYIYDCKINEVIGGNHVVFNMNDKMPFNMNVGNHEVRGVVKIAV